METIGGQAVIEGVMLRKKSLYSVAIRNPQNKIIVTKHKIKDYRKGVLSIFRLPVFRGIYSMYEMLGLGMKTLIYSSNISIDKEEEKLSRFDIFWLVLTSVSIAIGFFVILPYILTELIGISEAEKPIFFNIVDAVIKIAFFIIYVLAISRMNDIKRLFQYHGAEHKVVHCYEQGMKITVRNAKKYTPLHPRCGSSFLVLVVAVSIVLFSFIPLIIYSLFPGVQESGLFLRKLILLFARIAIVPLIAGLSYELLKLSGRYSSNFFFKIISLPGLAFQKLTTSEPDNKQIEVAIKAIKALI
jgi:uncharacterized protein YqhQ